jgi:hypothetical protein
MSFCPKRRPVRRAAALIFITAASLAIGPAWASNLDTIGIVLLRAVTTNLNGAGVRVAQVEGTVDTNQPPTFEVNPGAAGQPAGLFTFYSSVGSSSAWPNSVGAESWHADQVAGNFYGMTGGPATNVAHVDNYEAGYFYNSIIAAGSPSSINDAAVNQSFIFYPFTVSDQQAIDSNYDDYAARYNTLFVSGAGNGGGVPVSPPSTCYNGICVGAYVAPANYSSVGPTLDNGRAKPDITAPEYYSSYSTPLVTGAAAVLAQAALRGDGGSATNSAADIRTLKALLLNGAIKPAGWTNSSASPLDARYGAGVVNVFNSYVQLTGGKNSYVVSATVPLGNPHPPTGATGTVAVLSGWDYGTMSSSNAWDRVNHYYFNITNGPEQPWFTATATLVWNRQQTKTNINDLDLFLYDASDSNLVASSTSLVDNVEHLFVPQLPPGRYDLQVFKNGGSGTLGKKVTNTETYALAFEFFSPMLSITQSDTNAVVSWPVYPAGFVLESSTNFTSPPAWNTSPAIPVVTHDQNRVELDDSSGDQFFRLRRP